MVPHTFSGIHMRVCSFIHRCTWISCVCVLPPYVHCRGTAVTDDLDAGFDPLLYDIHHCLCISGSATIIIFPDLCCISLNTCFPLPLMLIIFKIRFPLLHRFYSLLLSFPVTFLDTPWSLCGRITSSLPLFHTGLTVPARLPALVLSWLCHASVTLL